MNPSWRKPFGMLVILAIILFWAILIASQSAWIGSFPPPLQIIIYMVAGIVWIAPMGPLLRWMETGQFRRPRD